MVIDTSSLLAILQDEPQRRAFTQQIEAAATCAVSTATLAEVSIVLEARFGPQRVLWLDRLPEVGSVTIVPLDEGQARIAREACRRFGKGRHRAALNLGDCFADAFAISRVEPLLCKGDDFPAADVEFAIL